MDAVKSSAHLVDPEIKFIIDMMEGETRTFEESYLETREVMKAQYSSDVRERYDVEIEEVWINNLFDDSKVRLVIVIPKNKSEQKHPLIYSVHGGGMCIGVPEMDNEPHAFLAHNYNFIGVSADYRLAPEFSQPTQLHDIYSGIKWCIDNAKELNIDTEKVAVAGGSAGAGLAGGLALYIRDRQEFNIHHLRLMLPMLDDRTSVKEAHPYNGQFIWDNTSNYYGWKSVLNQEPGSEGVSEYYSPARAKSLKGLPSTFLTVGSIELFADETLDFAKHLMYDGVLTELHLYPGYHHGGPLAADAFYAKKLLQDMLDALLRALKIHK